MKLYGKLLISMIAAGALALVVLAVTLNWRLGQGFVAFINAADAERMPAIVNVLSEFHATQGQWESLRGEPRRWRELLQQARDSEETRGDGRGAASSPRNERRTHRVDLWAPFWSRLSVYDVDRRRVIGRYDFDESERREAIVVGNQTVGWLGLHEVKEVRTRVGEAFLREQQRGLIWASIVMLAFLGVSAALLARAWTRPIRQIGQVTRRLAGGDFAARVATARSDEIGDLSRDIDFLAHSLGEADTARKRWMADTAHELRTPLAVLRGELEALLDGIRPLNRDAITSLHAEAQHLGALIEELRELALADAGALDYHMETVDLVDLVKECLEANAGRLMQLPLQVDARLPSAPVTMQGDARRLRQLVENLIENSLRYTDPGGELHVRIAEDRDEIRMVFDDSAPGVASALLPLLFDPFVRGDPARTRGNGGSGLGLAICRRIVEAHGGTIEASASPLGGLRITIRWPAR